MRWKIRLNFLDKETVAQMKNLSSPTCTSEGVFLISLGRVFLFSLASCCKDKSLVHAFFSLCGKSHGLTPFQFPLCLYPICGVVWLHFFICFFCASSFEVKEQKKPTSASWME